MLAYSVYPADSRVRREAESLVQRGDDVTVVCLNEPDAPRRETIDGVQVHRSLIRRYRGSSYGYLASYLLFLGYSLFKLSFSHIKHRYQVVQVHTMPDFLVFATLVPRLLGARILLDVHDLVPELYMTKFDVSASSPVIRAVKGIERMSVRYAHRAIAVSEPHLSALVGHGNSSDKFVNLLNVPDERYFFYRGFGVTGNRGRFEIVYHGTVEKRYGLETALEAVKLLKADIPGIRLSIIGDGSDLDRLVDRAQTMNLNGQVTFEKKYTQPQLMSRLSSADVGVVPLVIDQFTRFTIPTKMLEYVTIGIPVLITRIEAVEVYFDTAMVMYFEAGDSRDLAGKLLDLYHNPARRQQLVDNALRFTSTYCWERQKQTYYRLLDELTEMDQNTGVRQ
jgi:glycosyltransferase involved in cell wall biosynthesis